MAILSEEELNNCKVQAHKSEIRQNVKSHCTKIKEGIRNNGSMSGNRAIWELFQNAGDLVEGVSAEIKITLTNDAFVFSHKGKPFTFDSLCSLVKQVSSQEKEDDGTVGQFGTGFLTTHKFSRRITINGSMLISENPKAYVDIDNFLINRDNFDNIPVFIDDMTAQIEAVEDLMNAEQKQIAKEWTSLSYELNEERMCIAQTAIDEAIKLMPYVLTFNDNIGNCTFIDKTHSRKIVFSKKDNDCAQDGLHCKSIFISENDKESRNFDCYYIELHNGESRIILPLKSQTEVYSFGDIPRMFVHFPLIGPNYFGVNFLFHSHRFSPEEQRNNIIVPKDNDATDKVAEKNMQVLDEMTKELWKYLETHIQTWNNTIDLAAIHIKDTGYNESKTEAYYKELKRQWVEEYNQLKLIQIGNNRYSLAVKEHPLVLEPSLILFLSEQERKDYLSTIYHYAKNTAIIPNENELIRWSQIITEWDYNKSENFLTLERIVEYVSKYQGEQLHEMLEMIVAADHTEFFDKYPLIPNREGVLMTREELRNAKAITKDLYDLVTALDFRICSKFVDERYADIIALPTYNRGHLREELNTIVKKQEDECWNNPTKSKAYSGNFENNLIALCSLFTTSNGDSKRNRLMPIICQFENIEYSERHLSVCEDDAPNFDLFRQLFISLVENQMMKIQHYDSTWVQKNIDDLILFVDYARGDDYKNFCSRYAIYPDMNGVLHSPDSLKKNNGVNEVLFGLYDQVIGDNLKSKCVDEHFEQFYNNYAEPDFQYTSQSVAKEIQNKLSADGYKDTILLDIIDLTERNTPDGSEWRLWFKDIYEQRESIRYHLGSDIERKAINKMLKKKNPALIDKMAEVSERQDAEIVLDKLNSTIYDMEREAYIKMLGDYVEKHIEQYLKEALSCEGIDIRNEQCGQDFILSKDGYDDYFIEVKSRWEDKASAIMSSTQFHKAVDNPDRFALISAQMWHFDKTRVEQNETVELEEIYSNIRVCNRIGHLETELDKILSTAFNAEEDDIHAVGSYSVLVPQKVFNLEFSALIDELKRYFS